MTTDVCIVAFRQRLRQIENAKVILQEKLVDLTGIHRSYIGYIERGGKNITLKKAYEVCDALNIKLRDLV